MLRVGNFFTNNSWYYSDLELEEDKYCYHGDLLYAWSASFGAKIWDGSKTIFHYHIWKLDFDKRLLNKKFLYYYLEYDKQQIMESTTGSTMIHVSMENMMPRTIMIPPLSEQCRIVDVIDQYMSYLERLGSSIADIKLSIDKCKAHVLNLAIKGKLVSQDPTDEPASELLKRINPKSVASCDNPHYSNLPEGWVVCTIGEVANYINGKAFKPEDWRNQGLPIVRIQNLNDPTAIYNYSDEVHEKKYLVKNGDLLFAWAASLGTYIWRGDNAWLNQHIFKVEPRGVVSKEYLHIVLDAMIKSFYDVSHGSGMVHITRKVFENIQIAIPPLEEQKRIVSKIEELNAQLEKIELSLQA